MPPLGVEAIGLDALPTGSIAVPQLDAIAPLRSLRCRPTTGVRPARTRGGLTTPHYRHDSRLPTTTDSRLPTREGAPVLTRTAVLAALMIATVPILAQPPASTPPPGQAPRSAQPPAPAPRADQPGPAPVARTRHPRQPPPRAARVSRSTSRWNSRCPINAAERPPSNAR